MPRAITIPAVRDESCLGLGGTLIAAPNYVRCHVFLDNSLLLVAFKPQCINNIFFGSSTRVDVKACCCKQSIIFI